ncbi:TetR family transcriptional regulator [Actinomycetota bacterium]|nr:TetR family transcriptional regulator [Actinomycetota bacterium]
MARPRQFDEHEVLIAAREQFWHQGYEATSMSDLCAATGVASQSLYGAFGSKHDLFVRTLDEYCAGQVSGLEAGWRGTTTSPWTWLMAAVTFEDGGRLDLTVDGCYLACSTSARARLDDDVRDASRRTYDRILDVFTAAVADGQAQDEVRTDVAAGLVARTLLTAMQGLEFVRKSGLDDAAFTDAKAGMVDALTRAYAVDSGGDVGA